MSALRLGFAGTPRFALPALNSLAQSRHRIVAVFTQPDRPAGRGQIVHASPVKQRAADLGLPVLQPASLKTADAAATLRSLDLDALVVVAYGQILSASLLAIPRLGCFNIHASILPRWRGAAPIQRALLAGDAVTGVTIMRMEAALDTGPMLAVREVPIVDLDTAETLHDRLADLGGELIVAALDAIASGSAREEPQPSAGITYADKISKSEALIQWHDDASGILRRVRAFNPWPVAATTLDGAQLRVWNATLAPDDSPFAGAPAIRTPATGTPARNAAPPPGTVVAASGAGIDVACGRGVLRILRLQLAGRKPLAAGEFIKAHRLTGARFPTS